MYEVTRKFTGGALKGQTHTEITSVVFTVGQVVSRPIGGSPYRVIRVRSNAVLHTERCASPSGP